MTLTPAEREAHDVTWPAMNTRVEPPARTEPAPPDREPVVDTQDVAFARGRLAGLEEAAKMHSDAAKAIEDLMGYNPTGPILSTMVVQHRANAEAIRALIK